ncbi:MAG: DUF192 domain-containing protein [Minisyncoccia bacterium]
MKSKTFSQLSTLIVVLVSIYVLFLVGEKLAPTVRSPLLDQNRPSPRASAAATTSPAEVMPASPAENLETMGVKTPRGTIHAMIASTSEEQALGLGGRDQLPADAGMLFPFMKPALYGFWMLNMRFPLDMVWIAADKRVAGVTGGISPDTFPDVFSPPSPILYVLELDSGAAAKFGIATGTQLVF